MLVNASEHVKALLNCFWFTHKIVKCRDPHKTGLLSSIDKGLNGSRQRVILSSMFKELNTCILII